MIRPSSDYVALVSDLSQLSPQNHQHYCYYYIVTRLSDVCEVIVTITVHTLVHQGDTVLLPSVGSVRTALNNLALETLDCTHVIITIYAVRMRTTALLDA